MAPLSEDVEYIQLYVARPLYQHGYVAPFVALYGIWLYIWASVLGIEETFEILAIGAAVIGVLQALVALFCLWSVHFNCLCCYKKVMMVFIRLCLG